MKYIIVIIAILSLVFASCQKENDPIVFPVTKTDGQRKIEAFTKSINEHKPEIINVGGGATYNYDWYQVDSCFLLLGYTERKTSIRYVDILQINYFEYTKVQDSYFMYINY